MTDNDEPMVLRALDDGVLTLTLNRGARFNPLSLAMIAALDAEVQPRCARRLGARRGVVGVWPRVLSGARPQGDACSCGRQGMAAGAVRRVRPDDDPHRRAAAACHRARARHRDRRRMPARVDVRSRGRRRHGHLRPARREHRRLLLDSGGGRRAQRRPQTCDGNVAHRQTSMPGRRSPGVSSTASSPAIRSTPRWIVASPTSSRRAAPRRFASANRRSTRRSNSQSPRRTASPAK